MDEFERDRIDEQIAFWLLGIEAAAIAEVDLTDPNCPRGALLTKIATAIHLGTYRGKP